MPCKVVVGAQWVMRVKGKITDLLAERADVVVRYQGGNNAGHTVVVKGETFKLAPDTLGDSARSRLQPHGRWHRH